MSIITTLSILKAAAGSQHIPTKLEMRTLYERLRGVDDGLLPLAQTGLMNLSFE